MAQPQQAVPQVELSRLLVDEALAARLERLVAVTGAPGTWHRRKALAEYLDRVGQR